VVVVQAVLYQEQLRLLLEFHMLSWSVLADLLHSDKVYLEVHQYLEVQLLR
jgi:hypothetical protein